MPLRALLQVSVLAGFVLSLWTSTSLAAEPIRVTGRVFNWAQESGVAGVRVELFPAYEGPTRPAPLASARTDAEGSFEIAAPESGCFRLVVRAEGYGTLEHPLAPLVEDRHLSTANLEPSRPLEAAGEETRVSRRALGSDRPWGWRLAGRNETPKAAAASKPVPPRRISGKVTDSASGKPVAGALVWSGWPLVAPPARTDGEGRFHLDVPNVPPREGVWLESGAAGFLPAARLYARPGATEPVLVKLDPAAEISGKVSDPAGRPVAGASVLVLPPRAIDQGEESSGAWIGPDGRFRLLGLKPGSAYKLTARRKGFERASVPARTAPAGQPPPPPVQIVLGQGKTAFGRVVDAAGRPATGVKVVLIDPQTYRDQQEATTNEEGRFEIRHLSPGTYRLTAQHPDRAGLEVPEVEIPATPPSVNLGDLKLPADGAIEGRVTDSRGKPVEGAEVHVNEAQNLEASLSLNLGEGLVGQPSLRSLRTGADGSFRAKGLKSGSLFDLRVQHPAYAETTVPNVAAPTKEAVRIEMKASHSLKGQVVNAEGAPVAGASLVWLERGEGIAGLLGSRRPLGTADAQGRFQVSGLPAGSLDLEVSAEGYQTRWMEGLNIPEDRDLEDVRVVLGRGSWLDVQVLNTEREPVPDTPLIAHPQDLLEQQNLLAMLRGVFSDCTTDSQGRCRLSLPEPGAYSVQVMGKLPVNITVPPGGTSFEIVLPRDFEVSGRVVGKDGAGVPGIHVQSWSEAQEPSGAQTGTDGTFVFPKLAEGRYRLTAQQPGVGEASLDIEIAGQPVRDLELRLAETESGVVLTGRLTGLPPEDLKGALVQAQSPEANLSGFVKWDGSYRIENLEPGEWTVSARTGSGRQATGKVWIEPGATAATLDLDFAGGLTLSGRVLVDGSPLGGASVLAGNLADPGSGQLGSTAHDGSFALRGLSPGSLTVIVLGSPGISASRTVELAEDEEIAIEITTGTFKATVLSATGELLEGAVANLALRDSEAQNPFGNVSALSGPDGTLDAGRLAPGTYRLEIRKEGFQPREETVEILPGGAVVMEVRLADLLP